MTLAEFGGIVVARWTDKSLARRILAGDHDACVEFVSTYHAPIYRLLARLCRDIHLAEDLTQETFAAGWANIRSYAGSSSLSTGLHSIAYRKFLDTRRRREFAAVIDPDREVDDLAAATIDPLDAAMADEESYRLHQALARLPHGERDVLVLHYLQGLSYREMALVLYEPSGTVKWRTSRALDNLKDLLEARFDEHAEITDSATTKRPIDRRPFAETANSARA